MADQEPVVQVQADGDTIPVQSSAVESSGGGDVPAVRQSDDDGDNNNHAAASSQTHPAITTSDAATSSPSSPQPTASTSRLPPSPPPASKRVRRAGADGDAAAAGRGKRIFGLLNATLGKAKKEAEDRTSTAKRRAEILSRQQERLEQQRSELLHTEQLKKTLRKEYEMELRLVETILSGDTALKNMRAQKRRLASFLVTSTSASNNKNHRGRGGFRGDSHLGLGSVTAPQVPSSLPPSSAPYPVYFLPRKLTLEQEDLLDDQEDEVDARIEEAEKEWEERKRELTSQLEEVRKGILHIKEREQGARVDDGGKNGSKDLDRDKSDRDKSDRNIDRDRDEDRQSPREEMQVDTR